MYTSVHAIYLVSRDSLVKYPRLKMNLCVAQTSLPSTHIATSSLGKKSASYPLGLHITETRRRFSPLSALTTLPIPLSRRGDVLVDLITAPGKLPPSRANWPNLTDLARGVRFHGGSSDDSTSKVGRKPLSVSTSKFSEANFRRWMSIRQVAMPSDA